MKEKLNNALNDIDQRFIEEAARADQFSGHTSKILKIILIPAAAAVVTLCLFALKKPQPGGVDLIQPPPAASEALTLETETAESTAEISENAAQTPDDGVFSCDKHKHINDDSGTVTAEVPGTVVFSAELPVYGNSVMVSEQDGTYRLYCHLGSFLVEPGDIVGEGEELAGAGCPEGSDREVRAVQTADQDIKRFVLQYYSGVQDTDIRQVLESGGYDREKAQSLKENGVLPLDTQTLTDRNTQPGWQSGKYFGTDFYSEEMCYGVPVEVHSYQTGTVIKVSEGWNDGLGNYIIIDHGAGLATVYGHLGEIRVSEGQTVERSEVIAMTGSTGYTGKYGDILHFEIRENGTAMVEISVSANDDEGQYPEHDPEEENSIIADICSRGSEYDQIGAQLLIRDSVMPLDEENMLVTTENGYDEWKGGMHYGVDLAGTNDSSQVYSYQSGVVLEAAGDGWNYGMGSYIVIDHGSGLVTVYAHLSRVDVSEGKHVEKGEIIGMTGDTGYATGIHLHFEIRENGEISPVMGSLTDSAAYEQTAAPGTEICSVSDGVVEFTGNVQTYGQTVVVRGTDGHLVMYCHCSSILVASGDTVQSGESLAIAGSTDRSGQAVISAEIIDEDKLALLKELEVSPGEEDLPATPLIWPVGGEDGGVISEKMYGYGGYYGHKGIDIRAPKGADVFAAGQGTVTKAEWYYGYGNCVMIDHGSLVTVYGHLDSIAVTEGQEVSCGEVIGTVGSTGETSTGGLHFEVMNGDEQLDPVSCLPPHKSEMNG